MLLNPGYSSEPKELSGWVLTIKVADSFAEEVIDMTKAVPNVSAITTTPTGAHICLDGDCSLWTDDNNFKKLVADLKKFRAMLINNGKSLDGIKS